MNALTDQQLVRDYAERHSDNAFNELVRRHIDLVYSAALRMVRDAHLTEDVTQGVFLALAQNAAQLKDRAVLSGWLHRTARNLAANAVRSEVRRRTHEQEAAAMNELLSADPEPSWDAIAPHLDAALGELEEADRDALMLRYFEKKSAPEMAGLLGISEEAAQKRVRRAVERLREFFGQRGVTVGAAGLVVLLSAHAVQSAPVGLAVTASTTALAGAATSSSTIITATKIIAMTTLQKTLITATVDVLAGAGIYEARQAAQLREQNQTLQRQQAPLAEQLRQLQSERDKATNTLSWLRQELAKNGSNNAELLKLRGEIGVVRKLLAEAKSANGPADQPPLATAEAYLKRSYEHEAKREYEAELDDLNHAIELDPTLAQAYRERAGLYSRLPEDRGGEKQAVADYSRHLELKPNDVGSLLMRAADYEKLGDYDKSIADYTAVIESANQNTADFSNVYGGDKTDKSWWIASAHTMRAQIYKNDKHDYSSAIADYTATIQLNPLSPSAYRSRGECYEAIGETAKAQQDFAIEPKHQF